MDLTINFKDVSKAQAITLVKMAKIMEWCGQVGTSRNVTFFADGDGDFRPKVTYEATEDISYDNKLAIDIDIMTAQEKSSDFKLDYDSVAWQIDSPGCHDAMPLTDEGEKKYDELIKKHKILF